MGALLNMSEFKLIAQLKSAVDKIDPHIIDEVELDRMMRKSPTALAREALLKGELRERRMIIQAKEARTNRWLAFVALIAAGAALAVPFIEKLLGT